MLAFLLWSDRTGRISIPPVTSLVVNYPAFFGGIVPDFGEIAAVARSNRSLVVQEEVVLVVK